MDTYLIGHVPAKGYGFPGQAKIPATDKTEALHKFKMAFPLRKYTSVGIEGKETM